MPTPREARDRATDTYNAASDCYDDEPLNFWDYFGKSTITRLQLRPGDHVLDVACGSGASAIPAAEAVAPDGTVLAIDLAERLLAHGEAKAARRNLKNVRFARGDMMALNQPAGKFDAVVCVFGIFFVPDMVAAVRELRRMVKPGGTLAITTWGANLFEPGNKAFWDSIRNVRPDLDRTFNPWDRISEPMTLFQMLQEAGAELVEVAVENRRHPINGPADWWKIVCGSGYRGTLEQLSQGHYEIVHRTNLDFISDNKIDAVETNALFAIEQKVR